MSKSIKTDNEEIKAKLEAIESKQDTELTKVNDKVAQLDVKIDQSNQENDRKIEEALKKVNRTVAEAEKDSNEKLEMMSKMVEQIKEQQSQKQITTQIFENSMIQPSAKNTIHEKPATSVQSNSARETPTQAQIAARILPKTNQPPKRNPAPIPERNGRNDNVTMRPKMKANFFSSTHERQVAFKHALEWLGLFVTREEILAWVGDREKHSFTDNKLIRDQSLDGPRKNAFIEKIEANTSLHMEDIKIHQYFMSSNKGSSHVFRWMHTLLKE